MYTFIAFFGITLAIVLGSAIMWNGRKDDNLAQVTLMGFGVMFVLIIVTLLVAEPFKSSKQRSADNDAQARYLQAERGESIKRTDEAIAHGETGKAEAWNQNAAKANDKLKTLERR